MPSGSAEATPPGAEPQLDALYDFALTVTWDPQAAAEAVTAALARVQPQTARRGELFRLVRDESLERARPGEPIVIDPKEEPPEIEEGAGPEALESLALEPLRGLDPADRAALDLALRQGLSGADLATALDVTPDRTTPVVEDARTRADRLLGHALLARTGTQECPGLARTVGSAPPGLPALADAVDHHLRECENDCRARNRALPAPSSFLPSVPARPAPPRLRRLLPKRREPLRRSLAPVFGEGAPWRRAAVVVGLLAALALAVVVGLSVTGGDDDDGVDRGGPLVLEPAGIDLAAGQSTAEVSVRNDGPDPVGWMARVDVPWLRVAPEKGTLAAGSSVVVELTLNRNKAPEGQVVTSVVVQTGDDTAEVNVAAQVSRPPEVGGAPAGVRVLHPKRCRRGNTTTEVSTTVSDESRLAAVVLRVTGPTGAETKVRMEASGGRWRGRLGPFGHSGRVRWFVEARDTGGHEARSDTERISVADRCPRRR